MEDLHRTKVILAHLAGLAVTIGGIYALAKAVKGDKKMVVLIGDVGGTNIRLSLRRLCLATRTSEEIAPLTKIPTQEVASLEAAVEKFIKVTNFRVTEICRMSVPRKTILS